MNMEEIQIKKIQTHTHTHAKIEILFFIRAH